MYTSRYLKIYIYIQKDHHHTCIFENESGSFGLFPSIFGLLKKVWFITVYVYNTHTHLKSEMDHAFSSVLSCLCLMLHVDSAVLSALVLTCDRPHKAPYKSVQKAEMTAAQAGRSPQSHHYCPLWASIS